MKYDDIAGKSHKELICKGLKNIEFWVLCQSGQNGMAVVEYITGGNPKIDYFHIEDFSPIRR